MAWLRADGRWVVVILLGLACGASASAQAPAPSAAPSADSGRPHKSVYGKLAVIDTRLNGVAIKTDDGKRLAWRFSPEVMKEAAQFKVGDPMIVIYRQISSNEKRVTALAFPGSAASPIYVNTTGSRIIVRSSAAVNGVCGQEEAGPVSESIIPAGGMAEVLEACWCCAASGDSCTPSNKSGQGRALLVNCFK